METKQSGGAAPGPLPADPANPTPAPAADSKLPNAEDASSGGGWPLIDGWARATLSPTGPRLWQTLTHKSQVGLLTLYDMLKAADPAMTIGPVRLLEKHGGRHGSWRHPALAQEGVLEQGPRQSDG